MKTTKADYVVRRCVSPAPSADFYPWTTHGPYEYARWVTHPELSLRLAGYVRPGGVIDNAPKEPGSGWVTHHTSDVFRPVVYRLPRGRFAYGYVDPHNTDEVLLCFDRCEDMTIAARRADKIAQEACEEANTHDEAYHARGEYEELGHDLELLRRGARSILRMMRHARQLGTCGCVAEPQTTPRQGARPGHTHNCQLGERGLLAPALSKMSRLKRERRALVQRHGGSGGWKNW